MKILTLLPLLFVLLLTKPAFGFECHIPSTSKPAPLISTDLQKINEIKAKLSHHKTKVIKEIRALKKEEKNYRGKQKKGIKKKTKSIQSKIKLAKDKKEKIEKRLLRISESAEPLRKEISHVELSRQVVLCEIEEGLEIISNTLIPQFRADGCHQEVDDLKEIKENFQKSKENLLAESKVGIAALLVRKHGHDDTQLIEKLTAHQDKLSWPKKLAELSLLLEEISIDTNKRSIDRLKKNALRESTTLKNIKPHDRCNQVLQKKNVFLKKEWKSLKELHDRLSSIGQGDHSHALKLRNFLNYTTPALKTRPKTVIASIKKPAKPVQAYIMDTDPLPDPDSYGPPNHKVIVLYVHWVDDLYEDAISNRSELDERLRKVEDTFREFSYGQFRPKFDVCEVEAGMRRPTIASREMPSTMVQLCDASVNFNNYQWIVLYPTAWTGGKYLRAREYITNDNEGALYIPTITMGRNSFSSNTLMHEGGHALGLNHAHDVDCGYQVFGESCLENDDYGDRFDTMGSFGHFNCAYKERLGWVESRTVTPSASIPIPAIEMPSANEHCIKLEVESSFTEGIFSEFLANDHVTEPCRYLYIEYRRPIGYDRYMLNSLVEYLGLYEDIDDGALALHCATDEFGGHTWQLDCTPHSRGDWEDDFRDGLLTRGETCLTGLGYDISWDILGFESTATTKAWVSIRRPGENTCNGIDDNENGTIDEGCDDDGDDYCDANMRTTRGTSGWPEICRRGPGDCNDEDRNIFPGPEICDQSTGECYQTCGADEEGICDGFDTDQDGTIDEGCDDDGDGYCDASMTTVRGVFGWPGICRNGPNDCDDNNSSINPEASEICNNLDENCNGTVDEGCDDDGDGYCDADMEIRYSIPVELSVMDKKRKASPSQRSKTTLNKSPLKIKKNAVPKRERTKTNRSQNNQQRDYRDSVQQGMIVGDFRLATIPPDICPHGGGDCNDAYSSVNPSIDERCDTVADDNCNNIINEGCSTCTDNEDGTVTWVQTNGISINYSYSCHSFNEIKRYRCLISWDGQPYPQQTFQSCPPQTRCIDPDGPSGPTPAHCGTE